MGRASGFSKVLRIGYLSSLFMGIALLVLGGLLEPLSVKASTVRQGDGSGRVVYVAPFKLPITPISAQYFDRLIKTAEDAGADALVVQIDTPGGLVDSMQEIMKHILASRVPVITYVSPQGAQSASAGVFLVYASHVAAMAPNTTIGSAEVIFEGSDDGGGSSETPETGNDASMRRKVTNELVSKIRNLAVTHGRNADFAERAVRESANLGSQAALDQKVIDYVANNVSELLDKADGKSISMESGQATLHTKGAEIRNLSLSFGEEILLLITNPSVAFVLISLGTLGLTWEFINPGSVFPGVVGALFLLVGFLALGTLPLSAAGLVFLGFAFVLFIADIFMPSHGILTAGGIASLVVGGLLLINTEGVPGVPTVSPYVVAGVASALGAFFFYAVYKVFQARRYRPTTGREQLVGSLAEARTDLSPNGMVFVEGELWNAVSVDGPVPSGRKVRVVKADGLTLTVAPDEA
jgi:membrane-bound serine protease (ClpP class)